MPESEHDSDETDSLLAIADKLEDKAECLRKINQWCTADDQYFHKRKGKAREYEQAAEQIRQLAQSRDTGADDVVKSNGDDSDE